jgi:hypothetical protein
MVTNREQYLKRHNLKGPQSLSDLARTSKVSLKILQEVYNRGIGAYKTNPSSVRNTKGVKGGPGKKLSKENWAYARVYSFLNKIEGKRKLNHDLDLAKKI